MASKEEILVTKMANENITAAMNEPMQKATVEETPGSDEAKPMTTFAKALRETLSANEFAGDVVLLVVGRTGQGKSTLINSIIELKEEITQEGGSTNTCTDSVKMFKYPNVFPGVNIKIVDSPGLQDVYEKEQTYIQTMKDKCPEIHLILYCMMMTDKRIHNDDKVAMQKLYFAFGSKFWERVIFVFTCANNERCDQKDDRDEDIPEPPFSDKEGRKEMKRKRFVNRIHLRVEETKKFLIEEVKFDKDLVNKIRFVPAGYYKEDELTPDPYQLHGFNWLYDLLKLSCTEVKSKHKFSKLSLNDKIRLAIIIANDVSDKQLEKQVNKLLPHEEQYNEIRSDDDDIEESVVDEASQLITEQNQEKETNANPNGVLISEVFKKLGFCILCFQNLSSDCILELLQSFQNIDQSQLAMFSLVILSKGKTPHVFGSDNEVVSFTDIFNCFTQKKDQILPPPPSIFLFPLLLTTKPKQLFEISSQIPKNSITMAVAVTVTKDNNDKLVILPRFVDVLTNSSSTKSIKHIFKEIKSALDNMPSCQCECIDTLNENFVFSFISESPNTKEKLLLLEKRLKIYRALWSPIRSNTIGELINSKDEVIDIIRTERIARISTALTSLVIGSGLTVAGLVLIPFTFGVSIGLSVAGGVIGGVASLGGVAAFITSKIFSSKRLRKAEKQIQLDQQLSISINELSSKYMETENDYSMSQKIVFATDVSAGVMQGLAAVTTRSIGVGVAVGVEGAAESALAAIRATGNVSGIALAGASLAVTVPLDLGFIVYNGYHFFKSSHDKSGGKTESKKIVKWFITHIEDMVKSKSNFADVPEVHKIESRGVYSKPDCGYSLHIPSVLGRKAENFTVVVSTLLSGPFTFPEKTTLVSAIYDVKIVKKIKAPFYMEIEHCVSLSGLLQNIKLAIATVNFEKKSFDFATLPEGKFNKLENSSCVSIQIEESCVLCVLYEGPLEVDTLKYAAHYYSAMGNMASFWNMSVSFSKSLPGFLKYTSMQNISMNLKSCEFKFESPSDDTIPCLKMQSYTVQGWKISPHEISQVSKAEIDNFGHNDNLTLPKFDIDIQKCDDTAVAALEHDIQIKGTNFLLPIKLSLP